MADMGTRQPAPGGEPSAATELTSETPGGLPGGLAGGLAKDVAPSFEFFPPKDSSMEKALWSCIERLAPLAPAFMSVTYGAGGSTRQRTHSIVARIQNDTQVPAAAHLTCVGASSGEIDDVARRYWDAGIRHIVALRGDPPEGEDRYRPHPGGYAYAADLVAGLMRLQDFEISVAAYPEMHPEATSAEKDLDNLRRKLGAGAKRAITQFFFEPETYLRFRDTAAAAGIDAPIVPGILPVTNFKQAVRFAAMCGASVPAWMMALFDGLDDDAETRKLIAATVAAEQCSRLHREGVTDFHFYTLNRADLVYAICHILGIRATIAEGGGTDQNYD
ncbi:MAG: methylenetetrahydrofolate reductase [Rhodospirillales bacterium]